jgi:hypothetical protein
MEDVRKVAVASIDHAPQDRVELMLCDIAREPLGDIG